MVLTGAGSGLVSWIQVGGEKRNAHPGNRMLVSRSVIGGHALKREVMNNATPLIAPTFVTACFAPGLVVKMYSYTQLKLLSIFASDHYMTEPMLHLWITSTSPGNALILSSNSFSLISNSVQI